MKAMSSCSGFLSSFPTLHAGVQGDLAPRARKVKTVLRTEVIPRVKSGDGLKTRFLHAREDAHMQVKKLGTGARMKVTEPRNQPLIFQRLIDS